jgi:hypothetical protein
VDPLSEHAIAGSRQGLERLTVAQFHRMIEAGILREGAAVELIEGILVRRDSSDVGGDPMTHGPKHAYHLQRIIQWAEAALSGTGHHARPQLPITLDDSEPEPDIAVVRGSMDDYRSRHPKAADWALAIEVADSSLEYDRMVKAAVYASAEIAVYWIVNLQDRSIEVSETPVATEKRYRSQRTLSAGASATIDLGARTATLDVASLFS